MLRDTLARVGGRHGGSWSLAIRNGGLYAFHLN